MTGKQIVTINGKRYDAVTGLLIGPSAPSRRQNHATVAAPKIHNRTQRSQTLQRRMVTKKVAPKPKVANDIIRRKKPTITAKSPHVSRFAPAIKPQPQAAKQPTKAAKSIDMMPTKHPVADRSQKLHANRKPVAAPARPAAHQTSQEIKHHATQSALAAASPKTSKKPRTKASLKQKFPRMFSVASASLAVMVLAGYLTYINMPVISIRVAAAGAGIDASYPGYHPDGYRLAGPIAYSDGQVRLHFASNAGPQKYTLKETESNWDSSAVLENYVKPKVDGEYIPYQENGLTVYTYGNDAAWVNGGILYTISSENGTSLSNDQILRIATSL